MGYLPEAFFRIQARPPADLRGALGITSQQVCSALHGRLALMDTNLAAEVQLRCASSQ
jgi:hypothetical protein